MQADNKGEASYDTALVEWKDLEPWMRDNEYLQTGYRKASHSYHHSLTSLTSLHNETVNIWSHLLGALAFLYILHDLHANLEAILPLTTWPDLLALTVFHLSVSTCFLLSTIYHLLSNHSHPIHTLHAHLDHLGIVLVIYGSTIPALHFEFHCHPTHRNTYIAALTLCAFASAIFTLRPEFRTPHARRLRFLVYATFALAAFLPVAHGLKLWGLAELDRRMGLRYIGVMAACQGAGGVVYAARVPERWWPRRFDLCGASHQLMHVLVLAGAFSLQVGWMGALRWWREEGMGRAECAVEL